jgi:hypothetical protein
VRVRGSSLRFEPHYSSQQRRTHVVNAVFGETTPGVRAVSHPGDDPGFRQLTGFAPSTATRLQCFRSQQRLCALIAVVRLAVQLKRPSLRAVTAARSLHAVCVFIGHRVVGRS